MLRARGIDLAVVRKELARIEQAILAGAVEILDEYGGFPVPDRCHTLCDMKTATVTIRIDPRLERRLSRAAARSGRSRSAFVRDALERQLALDRLADLRRRITPFAEARGYLTDEDVFREIS